MGPLVQWQENLKILLNIPRYGPLALEGPQSEISVSLEGDGESLDVTRNNVVAALRPFTIGVMLPVNRAERLSGRTLRLCMRETGGRQRLLGTITLQWTRAILLEGYSFCLFETPACENFCSPAPTLGWYDFHTTWRVYRSRKRNPYNFQMTRSDLRCNWVFYICPRPVVLVTVEHNGASNMFPMDLIGSTDSPWFSMALRRTSPAIKLMQESRKMALADVPFACKDFAYELGKHHRKETIDWASLPFPTGRSELFKLPVAEAALKVREVRVEQFHDVGSHVLFLTRILQETPHGVSRNQMFHAFSSYRQYLSWTTPRHLA
jgi:flavin reductase (DIM6/NTAB) family NADH-FMN oxidoreductase RutF